MLCGSDGRVACLLFVLLGLFVVGDLIVNVVRVVVPAPIRVSARSGLQLCRCAKLQRCMSSRKVSARPTSRTNSRVRCTRVRRRAARSLKRREHTRTNEAVVRWVRLRALILPPCLFLLFCCPQATTDASTSARACLNQNATELKRRRQRRAASTGHCLVIFLGPSSGPRLFVLILVRIPQSPTVPLGN
jgi:hypothetical protein